MYSIPYIGLKMINGINDVINMLDLRGNTPLILCIILRAYYVKYL